MRCASQAAKVDVIYALSSAWTGSHADSDYEMLETYLKSLKPEETILVSVWQGKSEKFIAEVHVGTPYRLLCAKLEGLAGKWTGKKTG